MLVNIIGAYYWNVLKTGLKIQKQVMLINEQVKGSKVSIYFFTTHTNDLEYNLISKGAKCTDKKI